MIDDAELLARAAGGDHTAFGALVREHTPRMYRVALRITGSAAEAEDVVQEAWLAAWRSLAGFRQESAVSTWLYRVVTNSALAVLRRRRPTVSLDDPDPQSTVDSALFAAAVPGPEGRVVRAEEVDAVLRAVGRLEVSQRVPLVLRELEGLSYEEVADVLDVNVGALRSRLHRARVALLAELRER
ncbi:RNA polymerase sigma-70 factor, ECF subfamily [Amycolatopsis mediterranei S699]|uniref:RNA polymerase sigma-70 factor, ECF subfamily n=2 Tax=Amycolatopsis mediterranei TaxID=33910 RepID=A0A0H3D2N5_AMYMU|nr:sigma-70 family RNA polymerase sigma factor [Amycolatopsis mediterranei]ADJ44471.1 RNA polymerase sigma-70 factor, ECF subfamily [Amycolatopsis mediterranei U32]AEK41209.1 RNA polymerase sigma-70 factor, ECF subfamily protein [Amycolatopsis mediterranei S699]AFO76184.1 RNA polymerase sigma-70 factor, ECF subfamily [Amycolatopsis mediterranei S699]AGT83313.1 RNA polymerase sigma-70 factor, ECF subfamily [Amycolatopsis mediterranei RB]KDO06611.1 RNA polymerase sigma70 factor [Amycolatopsis me